MKLSRHLVAAVTATVIVGPTSMAGAHVPDECYQLYFEAGSQSGQLTQHTRFVSGLARDADRKVAGGNRDEIADS